MRNGAVQARASLGLDAKDEVALVARQERVNLVETERRERVDARRQMLVRDESPERAPRHLGDHDLVDTSVWSQRVAAFSVQRQQAGHPDRHARKHRALLAVAPAPLKEGQEEESLASLQCRPEHLGAHERLGAHTKVLARSMHAAISSDERRGPVGTEGQDGVDEEFAQRLWCPPELLDQVFLR